jgi:cystathionine beta-lyase
VSRTKIRRTFHGLAALPQAATAQNQCGHRQLEGGVMAGHDFDEIIDRRATDSKKWRYLPPDVLPMWVADSDFRCPQPVLDALGDRLRHGILGYSLLNGLMEEAVLHWLRSRFETQAEKGSVALLPGICAGLAQVIECFTAPGDDVAAFTPSYPPIITLPGRHGRRSLHLPLVRRDDGYAVDFAMLEDALARKSTTLLVLCNPHNPTGKVFTVEELTRIGELCRKHDVVVYSDEIHCDYVHQGRHVPFVSLAPEIASMGFTALAPSKTFNMAGLYTAAVLSPDREKFNRLLKSIKAFNLRVNTAGALALHAAYTQCAQYADDVAAYTGENLRFAVSYLGEHIPALRAEMPQGTYLLWADCTGLGLDRAGMVKFFMEQAKVGPFPGWEFGPEGERFARFNMACPRSTVREALERIATAAKAIGR